MHYYYRSTVKSEREGMDWSRLLKLVLAFLAFVLAMVVFFTWLDWYFALPVVVKSVADPSECYVREIRHDGEEIHHECSWAKSNKVWPEIEWVK